MVGSWEITFVLGRPIFRCYVSFREGNAILPPFGKLHTRDTRALHGIPLRLEAMLGYQESRFGVITPSYRSRWCCLCFKDSWFLMNPKKCTSKTHLTNKTWYNSGVFWQFHNQFKHETLLMKKKLSKFPLRISAIDSSKCFFHDIQRAFNLLGHFLGIRPPQDVNLRNL